MTDFASAMEAGKIQENLQCEFVCQLLALAEDGNRQYSLEALRILGIRADLISDHSNDPYGRDRFESFVPDLRAGNHNAWARMISWLSDSIILSTVDNEQVEILPTFEP